MFMSEWSTNVHKTDLFKKKKDVSGSHEIQGIQNSEDVLGTGQHLLYSGISSNNACPESQSKLQRGMIEPFISSFSRRKQHMGAQHHRRKL